MNNFLLFIAALLVLALSALFAAPYFIDWEQHRGLLETHASRLIGRDIEARGPITLTFLPAPYIHLEDVRLADVQEDAQAPFLTAKALTMSLSVPPLLRGAVEANRIDIQAPVLNLRIGEDGKGNWRGLGQADPTLPVLPQSVELSSVSISNGEVRIARGVEQPFLTLTKVDGELSARALTGPYKFTGGMVVDGRAHKLTFSTGRMDAQGKTSLKGILHDQSKARSYVLNGVVSSLASAPEYSGQFQLLVEKRNAGDGAPGAVKPQNASMPEGANALIELKSKLKADTRGAAFRDIELTLRHGDKPQSVRGKIDLAYSQRLSLRGALASRWIDLDSITGAKAGDSSGKADPAKVSGALAQRVAEWSALVQDSELALTFDQAVLAGDLIQDLKLTLEGKGDGVAVRALSATLPGGSSLSLSGALSGTGDDTAFAGRVALQGSKLNRLLGWGGLEAQTVAANAEKNFSLMGKLDASADRIALEEVTGEMLGSKFSGAISRSSGTGESDGALTLTLKSDRLDVSALGGPEMRSVSLPGLLRMMNANVPEGGSTKQPRNSQSWFGTGEARIDIDVGEITLPGLGTSAVQAGLHATGSDIDIRRLIIKSDTGLDLQASGTLSGLDSKPKGRIELQADATGRSGVSALGVILELDHLLKGENERLDLLAPARFTAAIESEAEGETGLKGTLDGTLGGSGVSLQFALAGGFAEWRKKDMSLSLKTVNKSGKALLHQLFTRLKRSDLESFDTNPGTLELTAKGVAGDGLATVLALKAAGLEWDSQGQTRVDEDDIAFTGTTKAKIPDSALLQRFFGAQTAPGRQVRPLAVSARLKSSGDVYALMEVNAKSGENVITGEGSIDLSADRPRLVFDLDANTATLAYLLEPLVRWEGKGSASRTPVRGVTRSENYWPDETINTGLMKSFDATLKLKARRLELSGGLVLEKAMLASGLEDGVLRISRLEGDMRGGRLSAEASLSALGSGMQFSASAKAKQLQLGKIVRPNDGKAPVKGAADLTLNVKGTGLSPHGLAASLNGSGVLKLGKGRIAKFSPGSARSVADEFAAEKTSGPPDEKKIKASAERHLKSGDFAFGAITAPVEIRNGVARVESLVLTSPAGTAKVTTFLELASLKLDSEWVLAPKGEAESDGLLVSVVFAGPLEKVGALDPDMNTQALLRYVTIRRMERDVERLEKLEVPKPEAPPAPEKPVIRKPIETPARQDPITVPEPPRTTAVTPRVDPPEADLPAPPATRPEAPAPITSPRVRPDAVTSRPLPPPAAVPQPIPATPPPPAPQQQQPGGLPWLVPAQPQPVPPPPSPVVTGPLAPQPPAAVPPEPQPPATPKRQAEPAVPVQPATRSDNFKERNVLIPSGD